MQDSVITFTHKLLATYKNYIMVGKILVEIYKFVTSHPAIKFLKNDNLLNDSPNVKHMAVMVLRGL